MSDSFGLLPGRAKPVQFRAGVTRDKILTAAVTMLAKHGRDRLTTDQIATEAGVSIGTFYRYFKDRVAILDAIYPNRDPGFHA